MVRWILQYCLPELPGLSVATKARQAAHLAISLLGSSSLAFLVAPVLPEPSTASTVLPLRFLLRRRPFFVGVAASSSVVGFRAGVFAGVLPSLFSPGASVGQNVELGHILNLGHRQLLAHLASVHVLVERANHSGGMNVGDVVLHPAESLDVLAQGLPFLLGNDMQITGLAMSLVASYEGANELMSQI